MIQKKFNDLKTIVSTVENGDDFVQKRYLILGPYFDRIFTGFAMNIEIKKHNLYPKYICEKNDPRSIVSSMIALFLTVLLSLLY
jgi:hypothetical protein